MKQFFTKKFRKIALLLSAIMILTMQSYGPAQAAAKTPAAPTIEVAQNTARHNQTRIFWKIQDSKYTYQVYRSTTSAAKGYKLIGTVKGEWGGVFVDTKAVAGKTNYYRVRAFYKSGGKTVYGKLSAPKGCKVIKLTTAPLKVTYKGKTITLVKDNRRDFQKGQSPTMASVEKIWGKPKTEGSWCTYKTGKTTISVREREAAKGVVGSISIQIQDKNGAVAGVKVGDSKSKALSILTKLYGKSEVSVNAESISCKIGTTLPLSFGLKSGKVSDIYFHQLSE